MAFVPIKMDESLKYSVRPGGIPDVYLCSDVLCNVTGMHYDVCGMYTIKRLG